MLEIIRKIRNDLRLSMSGPISTSMRDKGINYRMNFGVGIPRIIQISKKYEANKELANALWSEDVRELKILATLLYPVDQYSRQSAGEWVLEIQDQELREQLCKNLLQELKFANELVNEWSVSNDPKIRSTGYWLFARICITKSDLVSSINIENLLSNAIVDLKNESILLRQSALNTFKFYGRLSVQNANFILDRVASFENSSDPVEKEMHVQLKFEFGMYD